MKNTGFIKSKKQFKPDKELLRFAEWFSENYKILKEGRYLSDKAKYKIEYRDDIIDKHTGRVLKTPARIVIDNGVMEISKVKLKNKKITPNFVYYLVVWLRIRLLVQTEMEADLITLQFYCTQERNKGNIVSGWREILKPNETKREIEKNIKRLESLNAFVKTFDEKIKKIQDSGKNLQNLK